MATIILTFGGFVNFPATPPATWPSNLTWPNGQSPNGTSTITMTDADFQQMLAWVANNKNAVLFGAGPAPVAVTPAQLRTQWLNIWTAGSIAATQQQGTTPPVLPPPINMPVT